MVKRKTPKKADTKQLAVVAPQIDAKPYDVGVWAGIPQYRCKYCKFDTLQQEAMLLHLAETHNVGKIPQPPTSAGQNNTFGTDQVSTDGDLKDVFEIELEEVSSTTDEQGNEHKTFTIKEN